MEEIILKYNKDVAVKTGALSNKLYIFMLCIVALIVLISSAVFEFVCYYKGFSIPVMTKYTAKIVYFSLFVLFIWLFTIPVWYPAHAAENFVWVKKNNKLYRLKNKKENFFDKDNKLEDNDILKGVITKLPEDTKFVLVEEFNNIRVLRKTKKYAIIECKNNNQTKKIKIYNIYDNFEELENLK